MSNHICPWWMGYVLACPLRRLLQDPEKIFGPYIKPGMTVLDVGCGMGFLSLTLARQVGPEGRVVAMDLQPKMIDVLRRRATKQGLSDRIDARICEKESLPARDLSAKIDFALALYMVHEVPDSAGLLAQIHAMVAPEGKFLLVEPKGHVSAGQFKETEAEAQKAGFKLVDRPDIKRSLALLMEKAT